MKRGKQDRQKRKNRQERKDRLQTVLKTIPLAYASSKKLFLLSALLSVCSGIFGVAIVYATTYLFDAVGLVQGTGTGNLPRTVLTALALYFGILAVREVVGWVTDSLDFIIMEKSIIALSEMVHKKAARLDPLTFENPKYLDYIDNAGRGIYFIDYCASNFLSLFLYDIPYLVFVGIYLYTLKPVLFWVPVLIFVPVVMSQLLRNGMFVQLKDERNAVERKISKYSAYMTDAAFFKETRTLGCYPLFKKRYMETQEQLNEKMWKVQRRSQEMEGISKLLTLAGYYGVLFLLFATLMEGSITVGSFAAVFASLRLLYSTVNHVIVDRLGEILNSDYVEINSLVNYLTLPEREYGTVEAGSTGMRAAGKAGNVAENRATDNATDSPTGSAINGAGDSAGNNAGDSARDNAKKSARDSAGNNAKNSAGDDAGSVAGEIRLEKVSFSYPGREERALDDVDLCIAPGEVVAIVGENGSGKTTLAKVILGLYQPTCGTVSQSGIAYPKLSRQALFGAKSAVFQNFYKYLFDLRSNISISDMDAEEEDSRLAGACDQAGIDPGNKNVFPEGYGTLLTKQFGGVELSGGEWQRVAIARGVYRKGSLIVLDEPTAAIDPIEEGNVYRKFVDISRGKTTVIITHRLGSTKIADKILVMDHGRIAQVGNHRTLMGQEGLYKTMYESQAAWYVD